jgi:putative PIN family toxin of toxin-antitoxin system
VRPVVLDTNVLVSGFIARSSTTAVFRALRLARTCFKICVSDAIEAELIEVFDRPKIARYAKSQLEIAKYLESLIAGSVRVSPTERITASPDPKDNIFLEAALAGGAIAIVTGDRVFRTISPWRGIAIVSPSEFVDEFGGLPARARAP